MPEPPKPAQHLRLGGFADLPIRYARYPMAVPFLYLYPMSLGLEGGAKALNLLLGLALLVATYRLVDRGGRLPDPPEG